MDTNSPIYKKIISYEKGLVIVTSPKKLDNNIEVDPKY